MVRQSRQALAELPEGCVEPLRRLGLAPLVPLRKRALLVGVDDPGIGRDGQVRRQRGLSGPALPGCDDDGVYGESPSSCSEGESMKSINGELKLSGHNGRCGGAAV